MNPIMTELLLGGGLGAAMQTISEGLKAVHGLIGGITESMRANMLANNEQYRLNLEARAEAADAAAKRSNPWIRGALALIVFAAAFVLSYVNGWTGTLTSIVFQKEPWLNLFGLLQFGGGTAVKEARGFVLTPDFWQTVRVIAFFFFGVGAVRTGKKVL